MFVFLIKFVSRFLYSIDPFIEKECVRLIKYIKTYTIANNCCPYIPICPEVSYLVKCRNFRTLLLVDTWLLVDSHAD